MCAIYGFVNYKHLLSGQQLKELVRNLSIASEVRGTDASGIAYVKNGYLSVYKTPKPSHEVDFFFPSDTTILTGHTRWTTQGSAKNNCNNHPFVGNTADGSFALCHNGILRNDKELAVQYHLPKTEIKTDTYVAVQLLERHSSLCFETIAEMCETVRGDFVFTILNDDNTLYIAKGNNPICLIHSERLGLYIYSSTSEIMTESLKGTFLEGETFELIHLNGGDIISIDKHGNVKNYIFDFVDDFPFGYSMVGHRGFSWYDEEDDDDDDYLTEIYQMYGIDPDDLLILREFGYDDEDIEMMCYDQEYLQYCLEEARTYFGYYDDSQSGAG